MSGLEIIGVVLGVLPLLVRAIGNYNATKSVAGRLFRPQRELRSIYRTLTLQLQEFRNTTHLILLEVTSGSNAEELIRDPASDRWRETRFATRLRNKLGSSHAAWQVALEDVSHGIRCIGSHMQLQFDGNHFTGEADVDMFQRLRIGFGKTKINEAMASVESGNRSFKSITEQAIRISKVLSHQRLHPPNFRQLRMAAEQAFVTVDSGLSCSCKFRHVLCLGLQLTSNGASSSIPSKDRELKLGHHVVLATKSPLTTPLETEYVADGELSITVTGNTAVCISQMPVRNPSNGKCLTALIQRGVVANSSSIIASLALPRENEPRIVPVRSLLPSLDDRQESGKLRKRARSKIALLVASSLLQLYNTPWLLAPTFWEQITLIRSNDGLVIPTLLLGIALDPAVRIPSRTPFADPMNMKHIRNDWVYGLGIFLIELCLGETITQLCLPEDDPAKGALPRLTEFNTAIRLIENVIEEYGASPRYVKAVDRCIRCDFDERRYDLNSESFCRKVFTYIVDLLREDVEDVEDIELMEGEAVDGSQLQGSTMSFSTEPICF